MVSNFIESHDKCRGFIEFSSFTQARHQSFNRNNPKCEIVRETLGESHEKR